MALALMALALVALALVALALVGWALVGLAHGARSVRRCQPWLESVVMESP